MNSTFGALIRSWKGSGNYQPSGVVADRRRGTYGASTWRRVIGHTTCLYACGTTAAPSVECRTNNATFLWSLSFPMTGYRLTPCTFVWYKFHYLVLTLPYCLRCHSDNQRGIVLVVCVIPTFSMTSSDPNLDFKITGTRAHYWCPRRIACTADAR